MLNLGDRVKHLDTGEIGIVIGYGKRIINNKCSTTLKVRLVDLTARKKATIKDTDSKWFPCPEDYRISPRFTSRAPVIKPVRRLDLVRLA